MTDAEFTKQIVDLTYRSPIAGSASQKTYLPTYSSPNNSRRDREEPNPSLEGSVGNKEGYDLKVMYRKNIPF